MNITTPIVRLIGICMLVTFFFAECKKDKPTVNDTITPRDILSAGKYQNLIVEIQYVDGYKPTASTLNNLKTLLEQRVNKPGGITIAENMISSPGKATYSFEDIKDIEKSKRSQHTAGATITTYILFLDGDYAENSGSGKVLGIAYGTTSMAIFEKTIRDYSGGIGKPSNTTLESTVINHEFGHTLGLVNNGTNMQTAHQDTPNGAHCNNEDCLMYFTAETSNIVGNLIGGVIPELDANCINDLKANGGK